MFFFMFFIVAPIIELIVIVEVSIQIGVLNTVGLLILIALIGVWLIKREGLKVFSLFADAVQSGQVPSREIADELCLLMAGVLLVLPGFISDIVALFLLFPPTRSLVIKWLRTRKTLGGFARVKVIRASYDGRISDVRDVTDASSTEIKGELDP